MTKQIWTTELRTQMYRALTAQFGPLSEWKSAHGPGGRLNADYDKFCDAFAVIVGANSGEAVKQQIAFGLPIRGQTMWTSDNYARMGMSCLTAAIDAGFIRNKDLPDMVLAGKSKKGVPAEAISSATPEIACNM